MNQPDKIKFNLHMHTTESDGELSPLEVIALALEKEFGLISITDHDKTLSYDDLEEITKKSPYSPHYISDEATLIEKGKERLVLIKGSEITALRTDDEKNSRFSSPYAHILGIGYKGEIKRFDYLDNVIEKIKEGDGIVIAVHPLAAPFWGIGEKAIRKNLEKIDAIEMNGLLVGPFKRYNKKAMELALSKDIDKPLICGGDYHFKGTYFDGFYNISEYISENDPKLLYKDPMRWLEEVLTKIEYTIVPKYETKGNSLRVFALEGTRYLSSRIIPRVERAVKHKNPQKV